MHAKLYEDLGLYDVRRTLGGDEGESLKRRGGDDKRREGDASLPSPSVVTPLIDTQFHNISVITQ